MDSSTQTQTRRYPAIAENVYLLRKRRGWTQQQLAVQVGVKVDTIRRIERGDPGKVATLDAVAHTLGVTLEALLQPVKVGGEP